MEKDVNEVSAVGVVSAAVGAYIGVETVVPSRPDFADDPLQTEISNPPSQGLQNFIGVCDVEKVEVEAKATLPMKVDSGVSSSSVAENFVAARLSGRCSDCPAVCDDTSSAAPDAADAGIVMHVSSSLVMAVLALAGSKLQDLWSGTPGVRAAGFKPYWNKAGECLVGVAAQMFVQFEVVFQQAIVLQGSLSWPDRRLLCVLRAMERMSRVPCRMNPAGQTNYGMVCYNLGELVASDDSGDGVVDFLTKVGYSYDEAVSMAS